MPGGKGSTSMPSSVSEVNEPSQSGRVSFQRAPWIEKYFSRGPRSERARSTSLGIGNADESESQGRGIVRLRRGEGRAEGESDVDDLIRLPAVRRCSDMEFFDEDSETGGCW